MNKTVKQIFSLLLCVLLLCGTASAAAAEGVVISGVCGTDREGGNVKWTLDADTGVLEIKGDGMMRNMPANGAPWFAHWDKIRSVTVCDGVTYIGRNAFMNCSAIERAAIPGSVTRIGDSAFYGCTAMTDVTISEGVMWIDDQAFYDCTSLTRAAIPAGVTMIGEEAFRNCRSLAQLTIPDSVASIGTMAFCNCMSLTQVTIPKSVSCGSMAFSGCSGLTDVTFQHGVTKIVSMCFYACSKLARVKIPATVRRIEALAFYGCNIQEVFYASDQAAWNRIIFESFDDPTERAPKIFDWMELDKTSLTLIYKKQTETLTASEPVSWASSNEKVVKVSDDGTLVTTGRGKAVITATSLENSRKTTTCTVDVKYTFGQWLIVIFLFGWIWY